MAPSTPNSAATRPKREMKVLGLGLPRTGSASIREALTILGYQDVHHGVRAIDTPSDWEVFHRAADASFPFLPDYRGTSFTRQEWDEVFGHCEGATDVAATFAPQLIEAYPQAKVIMVIRDFEPWWKSMDQSVLKQLYSLLGRASIRYVEPLLGSHAGIACRKMTLGMFRARTVEEIRQNARETYDRHHRVIREMVSPEMLLEYRMGEGWQPICDFLEKPVPDIEFPRINEAAELKRLVTDKAKSNARQAGLVILPWVAGAVVLSVGIWVALKARY